MQILWVQDVWIHGIEAIYWATLNNGLIFRSTNKYAEYWSKQGIASEFWASEVVNVIA